MPSCAILIVASCALAACALLAAVAEATPAPTPSPSTSDAADTLESWYEGQFRANETHLLGLPSEPLMGLLDDMNASASEPPCRGMPSVQVRSAAANGGCPALFTSWGVACTCLEGYATQRNVWTFNVKKKGQTSSVNDVASVMVSSDVLEIDVIETLLVPFDLERLYVCCHSYAHHLFILGWLISTDVRCWIVE